MEREDFFRIKRMQQLKARRAEVEQRRRLEEAKNKRPDAAAGGTASTALTGGHTGSRHAVDGPVSRNLIADEDNELLFS